MEGGELTLLMKEWIMRTTMDNFGYCLKAVKRNKDGTIRYMERAHFTTYSNVLLVYWAMRLLKRPNYISIVKPETGTILKEHKGKGE